MSKQNLIISIALLLLILSPISGFILPSVEYIDFLMFILGTIVLFFVLFLNRSKLLQTTTIKRLFIETNHFFITAIALLIVIIVGYFSQKYYLKIDTTKQQLYSLSPSSIDALKHIQEKMTVIGFYTKKEKEEFFKLFNLYKEINPLIELELLDPIQNPQKVEKYSIRQTKSVVFLYQDNKIIITNPNEKKIITAIIKIIKGDEKEIIFLTGHGEKQLQGEYSVIKQTLLHMNYHAFHHNIVTQGYPSLKASTIVIAGPKQAFLPKEIAFLKEYLKSNGRLVVLVEPGSNSGLEPILSDFGVNVRAGMLALPPNSQIAKYQNKEYFLIPNTINTPHPITQNHHLPYLFYKSTSFNLSTSNSSEITPILNAIPLSRQIPNLHLDEDKIGSYFSDQSKYKINQPLYVGVISKNQNGILVAFGDSDFISNPLMLNFQNGDLFLNTILFLTGDIDLINIKPKRLDTSKLLLSHNSKSILFYLSVIVYPLLLLCVGLLYWYKRSKR